MITALTIIWEAADRICGKRLKAVLTTFVVSMERNGHLRLDPAVKDRLLRMSAATTDRLLRPVRALAKQGRRKVSVNTPLRKSITIRIADDLLGTTSPGGICVYGQVARAFRGSQSRTGLLVPYLADFSFADEFHLASCDAQVGLFVWQIRSSVKL